MAILGKARRPQEALHIFNLMLVMSCSFVTLYFQILLDSLYIFCWINSYNHFIQGDFHIYPDAAAYHSITVTLGQTGLLKELLKIIESMRQRPFRSNKNMFPKNWDPVVEPDVIVYNAVREYFCVFQLSFLVIL